MTAASVGVVAALPLEARCLDALAGNPRLRLTVSGMGPVRARQAAEMLVTHGAAALISFGICGGLDPRLRPGHLVLPAEMVTDTGERLETTPAWRSALAAAAAQAGLQVSEGRTVTGDIIVASADEKIALYARLGAVAVDMESHAVGGVAAAKALPFLAVRAVADPAESDLCATALAGFDSFGNLRPLDLLRALARRPGDLGAVIALGRAAWSACDSLKVLAELPPLLGGGDLR